MDFWSEYGQAAGVFQIGENFNGNSAYVGPYQQHLDSLLNYPMYFTIKDCFMGGQSMRKIGERYDEEGSHFKDIDALGLFVDNHDNARFLNSHNDITNFKSALAFALTGRGIPIFYYGSEQNFGGGNDPMNREVMWNNFDTNSDTFKFIQTINNYRTKTQSFNHPFAEKW
jgi:alpha-amylase